VGALYVRGVVVGGRAQGLGTLWFRGLLLAEFATGWQWVVGMLFVWGDLREGPSACGRFACEIVDGARGSFE